MYHGLFHFVLQLYAISAKIAYIKWTTTCIFQGIWAWAVNGSIRRINAFLWNGRLQGARLGMIKIVEFATFFHSSSRKLAIDTFKKWIHRFKSAILKMGFAKLPLSMLTSWLAYHFPSFTYFPILFFFLFQAPERTQMPLGLLTYAVTWIGVVGSGVESRTDNLKVTPHALPDTCCC